MRKMLYMGTDIHEWANLTIGRLCETDLLVFSAQSKRIDPLITSSKDWGQVILFHFAYKNCE